MVASLLRAVSEVAEPVIVSYSDIVFRPSVVRGLISASGDVVISYDLQWLDLWKRRFDNPLADAESFRIDESGRVLEIGGDVADVREIEGQYMGLLKLSPAGFDAINDFVGLTGAHALDMTATLSGLIKAGQPVYGFPCQGGWCEIDSPRDLEVAEALISEGKL
jgi:choline kinase